MSNGENSQYTEEEQRILDAILGVEVPRPEVGWGGLEWSLPDNQPNEFDSELFNDFLSVFFLGREQFVRQFGRDVIDWFSKRTTGELDTSELVTPDISLAEYHLYAEAVLGIPWDEIPQDLKDTIHVMYETMQVDIPASTEAAEIIKESTDVLIALHEKGILPEELSHLSPGIVGAAITNGYSDQADLAYQAWIGREARNTEYMTKAAYEIDPVSAEELKNKLDNNEITAQEYLDEIDRLIDSTYGYNYVQDFIEQGITMGVGEMPQLDLSDPVAKEQARVRGRFQSGLDYYGLGTLDLDVYSDMTATGKMPLYQNGLGRLLFANASPEDIMDTQLLLVEAGFLRPFDFVYGVLDDNDGGTIQAIEAAMSRFNLNGDGVSKEDLYSILLAPGSTAANLNVFLKEFFKDTLADYGYGTGAFETNYSGENAYENIFQFIQPNFSDAKSYISDAITEGLGRPPSDAELQVFFDEWSKESYALQKQNFDIRQRNMQADLEDARRRRNLAGQGRVGEFTPSDRESTADVGLAMSNSFDEFMRNTYGDIITGSQADAQYRKSFASLMGSLANIANQPGN
ncbi:MAG: hypothetical protein CL508_05165 [Actinobacteria bacterium]|nr:hypothetical protein [Actinomycetota bacterium]|tara:strand:- start:7369 stop:9087 length:1719 start_codon:yes stop_codon:yes gene_type:complete